MTDPPELPWHVIHGDTLMQLLRRCHAGEDPELVYAEEYANSDRHDQIVGEDAGTLHEALREALAELADGDLNDDGHPVLVAWGVDELAAKLAEMLVVEETS
jgi:hypothetical protein